MASKGGIADDLLVSLADDIETGEQMEALGRALGFKPAAINKYTETNRIEGRVTCKGTRDMLFDWRQTAGPRDQHCKLKEALEGASLTTLSQDYLKDILNVEDIKSKMIGECLGVLQCRKKLENMYLDNLCKIQMKPWDPNDYAELNEMHTRVTMVTKDKHGRDTVKREILHGSVTEIFSRKINNRLPDRILISAAAGRGKTTAVAKMAYDWANKVQGSGLEELPLLFILKLRNAGQYTLGEAIKSQLLRDVEDVTPEELEDFIRKNQNICHIIFDGLDEYGGIKSGSNIVKIMRWEEYCECRVLVTTRPHLNNFFNEGNLPRKYTKMEIEGFTRETSRDYIDKFFAFIKEDSSGEGLKVYLDGQPLINELLLTPLFCLMVCHLWGEGKLTDDISTQTGLLDRVNEFLMHHANTRSNEKVITTRRLRIILTKLGEVALDALLSDAKKLVFTPYDFRKSPTILASACELGIISQTDVTSACLPQSDKTTSTTIEFYHKLAQEHCAAKHIAAVIDGYWLPWMRWNRSKLDKVLRQIEAQIGDYENILRFTAGTGTESCIKILEAILTNKSLDDKERYRILLDCSSESTSVTEGRVSSLVQRCVSARTIVLKSSTVYTVVGMQNLPYQLKTQVREVTFEGSVLTADVTKGLWSCLESFIKLRHLTISDSSFSFPSSPPVLPYVTKLKTERVASQSYKDLLSSLPGLEVIDIIIDDVERDISQITAGLQRIKIEQLTDIRLQTHPSQEERIGRGSIHFSKNITKGFRLEIKYCSLSAEMTDSLWSYFRSFSALHRLNLSDSSLSFPTSPPELPHITILKAERMTSQNYEGLLSSLPGLIVIDITIDDADRDISQITADLQRTGREELMDFRLQSLPSQGKRTGRGSIHYKNTTKAEFWLEIKDCLLSAKMTDMLWSCLRPFSTLRHLTISDSSLRFPPSPPELPDVTKLTAERVTLHSYEGLLSSLPGLTEIYITTNDADRVISQIIVSIQRTRREQLTDINLTALPSFPPDEMMVSRETMRGLGLLIREQTKNLQTLHMEGVTCRDEEGFIDLIECCRHVKTMKNVVFYWWYGTENEGSLASYLQTQHTSGDEITVELKNSDSYTTHHWYNISRAV